MALIALANVALAFFVALVVVVFTALAIAVRRCLLSTTIALLPAAHLLSTDAGASAASHPPAESLLSYVALYFIMADCYIVALAPTPSSHCHSRRNRCHPIVIVSLPATHMEESVQKKEKAQRVYF
jgi:hypothetical protein